MLCVPSTEENIVLYLGSKMSQRCTLAGLLWPENHSSDIFWGYVSILKISAKKIFYMSMKKKEWENVVTYFQSFFEQKVTEVNFF